MPKIQQNFSVPLGDDAEVSLDINPDVTSLVGTNITFRAYAQEMGVPVGDPVVTKNLDAGLEITDPDYGLVLITFEAADTDGLAVGNYAFEITTWDIDGKRATVTEGIMTLTRTSNPEAL